MKSPPLTHEKDAEKVYVVSNEDGELCGVYGSVNRACAYILDWLSVDGVDVPFDHELRGSGPWTFNDYIIRESTLRK